MPSTFTSLDAPRILSQNTQQDLEGTSTQAPVLIHHPQAQVWRIAVNDRLSTACTVGVSLASALEAVIAKRRLYLR